MKTQSFHRASKWLLLNVAGVMFAVGCASDMKSFNQDYGQNLQTAPKYSIKNVNDSHFKIEIDQGSPMTGTGAQRAIYLKSAASTIARTEATKRGWKDWNVDYIQERDLGWKHILVAEVTRKNPAELKGEQPNQ